MAEENPDANMGHCFKTTDQSSSELGQNENDKNQPSTKNCLIPVTLAKKCPIKIKQNISHM